MLVNFYNNYIFLPLGTANNQICEIEAAYLINKIGLLKQVFSKYRTIFLKRLAQCLVFEDQKSKSLAFLALNWEGLRSLKILIYKSAK